MKLLTQVYALFLLCRLLFASMRHVRQVNYCFPRLVPPMNGVFVSPCNNFLGATCDITCLPGFTLIGTSRITCNPQTSQWTAAIPDCVNNAVNPGSSVNTIRPIISQPIYTCAELMQPANGQRSGLCGPNAPTGSQCLFSCNSGFILSGFPVLTCDTNGMWTPQVAPICLPQSILTPVTSMATSRPDSSMMTTSRPQSTIMSTAGSRPSSSSSATMSPMPPGTSGSASGGGLITTPSMSSSCPPLYFPLNGIAQGNCRSATVNQNCYFSCNPGFILSGSPVLTCTSQGKWNPTVPPVCLTIGQPINFIPLRRRRICIGRAPFCRCYYI